MGDYHAEKARENRFGHGARPMPRVREIIDQVLSARPIANPNQPV
jgi:hypothetical protein